MEFVGRTFISMGLVYMGLMLEAASWGVYEFQKSLAIVFRDWYSI